MTVVITDTASNTSKFLPHVKLWKCILFKLKQKWKCRNCYIY